MSAHACGGQRVTLPTGFHFFVLDKVGLELCQVG